MKIKTLIIGLGKIGMGYDLNLPADEYVLSHARAFFSHQSFELVCGVDPIAENREIFSEKYLAVAYEKIEHALLAHPEIDFVIIATPTGLHKQVTETVLSLIKPRVILCEKPLAHTEEEATFILKKCLSAGVQLYVNYIRRADPGAIRIREMISSGEMRGPVKAVVWYSKGIFHNGSHFLDLLKFWLGSVSEIKIINYDGKSVDGDCEPDIYVRFAKGSAIFVSGWEEYFSHYSVELLSPSGRLMYDRGGERIFSQAVIPDQSLSGYMQLDSKLSEIDNDMRRYQWNIAEEISRHFNGFGVHLCTGEQALDTAALLAQTLSLYD